MGKTRQKVLGLSPGYGGSCISENKRYIETALKPNLFASTTTLQEQRSQQRRNLPLVRVPMRISVAVFTVDNTVRFMFLGLGIMF
jgi:hypothetical protein